MTNEQTPTFKEKLSRLLPSRRLGKAALKETDEASVPPEVLEGMKTVEELPSDEQDRRLMGYLALCRLFEDTQEIPSVLSHAVHDTAENLIEEWQPEDYTIPAVVGLADAYSITGDEKLIETAIDVADVQPQYENSLAPYKAALAVTAETALPFNESLSIARSTTHRQKEIPMPIKTETPSQTSLDEDFDWVYKDK